MTSCHPYFAVVTATVIATVASTQAQAPTKELKGYVLSDVGPLPAPSTCGCVTAPFTVLPLRPGWGYGDGLAAPDTDAPPSRFDYERRAEMDRETLANLGLMYADAIGGNGNGSIELAYEIAIGTALKRDDALATQWFLLAASQGHPDAYVQLGHRYYRGVGVEQDDAAAAYWFGRGASSGNRMAMTALGGLYAAGRGVPQDWAAAAAWWRKAAAWRFVGDAYACGLGVAESMEEAVVAYTNAADAGDAQSATQLGHIHSGGCAPSPDLNVASTWYEKAANRGYPEAQVGLSELLLRPGPNYLPAKAYFWAKLAELRLPSGALRTRAHSRAVQAARRLSPMETASTDVMIGAIIASSSGPMNK